MTVRNRRGDLLCDDNKTVVKSNDTVFFYLNESFLAENEIFVSMVSFDGGSTYGAITEVENQLFAVTPQSEGDIIVRFYIFEGDSGEVRNPSDGEKLYTVRYTAQNAEFILAELTGNAVKKADGVEYYSGGVPTLKIYPSDQSVLYATVDDGNETGEYTVRDQTLTMKLTEGTYKLDVFALSDGSRIHAQGFPRTVCYDTKAPSLPSFTICLPEDGGYYPEFKERQYYASGSLRVEAESTDRGSGVEKIYMKIGNGEVKETDSLQVMAPFSGTVYAKSVDRAGNATPWVRCAESLKVESRAPEITFRTEQKEDRLYILGRAEDDSGLREMTVTCDGRSLLSYQFENGKELLKEKEFSFSCPLESVPYGGQMIEIKASDLAGNRMEKQIRTGKSDLTPPEISVEGCEDYDVKRENVHLHFSVSDENPDLTSVEGQAVRMDRNGKVMDTTALTFPDMTFTEEGNYDLTINAADACGNKASRKWSFMIDKTPPVIQGVQEYDGQVMDVFPSGQEAGISVSDLSGVTYRVYLNGKDYDESSVVREPGKYVLRVMAEDEAGNTNTQQAEFRIAEVQEAEVERENVSPLKAAEKKTETTGLDGETRINDTMHQEHPTPEAKDESDYKNIVPFVAVSGILFLILLGTVCFFVFKGNLTQNTGCDKLNV